MQHTIYRRLTNREREEISRGLAADQSLTEIARTVHRHPATISREVRRGSGSRGEYRAFSAGQRAMIAAASRRSLPVELKKTLTYDQGKEMLEHKRFTIDTGIQVYFAHPGSPWERGTNENTNGLVRQYFPKGTDFSKVSRYQIKRVQRRLNDRPRAVLDYEKPDEAINRLVALKV